MNATEDYKKFKKLYRKKEWFQFRKQVLEKDNYQCYKCETNDNLQIHHHVPYIKNKKPWEYEIAECITLCKGCHAKEHGIIEPNCGWELIEINDLGNKSGECERPNCGQSIRYEHLAYHTQVGYRIIGSTCIEFLTEEDKKISSDILYVHRKYGKIIEDLKNNFRTRKTKNNKDYLHIKHILREYGTFDKNFQIRMFFGYSGDKHIKINYRESKYEWGDKTKDLAKNISLNDAKYIAILLGIYYTDTNDKVQRGIIKIINSLELDSSC